MKIRNSMILLLALAMLFVACGKDKTEPGQDKKSVLIKFKKKSRMKMTYQPITT